MKIKNLLAVGLVAVLVGCGTGHGFRGHRPAKTMAMSCPALDASKAKPARKAQRETRQRIRRKENNSGRK